MGFECIIFNFFYKSKQNELQVLINSKNQYFEVQHSLLVCSKCQNLLPKSKTTVKNVRTLSFQELYESSKMNILMFKWVILQNLKTKHFQIQHNLLICLKYQNPKELLKIFQLQCFKNY